MAHGVTVIQNSIHHDGDDFHIAVGMHAKNLADIDPVVVDHQEGAEPPPIGIVVAGEAEAMPTIEPALEAVEAFGGGSGSQASPAS